ncbi:hypothetical protein [Magnetospirillum aberrantis]|uniref:RDD family protein n=1 Tax=Magnetospirillum aberrantis SpK TaxID=908842 RepID=A0A7C9UWD0_9PROT|nr:hypothetical protein [Magnetospirillum aberrantis]NFV80629.1 hypothetical protein [Magnetospirillum aberrantis SpK]
MTRTLFLRWLLACGIDYLLLAAAVVILVLGWPGVREPLSTIAMIFAVGLFSQPLGEILGGTVGQRLAGIRLVWTSGDPLRGAVLRHGYRLGMLWAVVDAIRYWYLHRPLGWEWHPRRPLSLAQAACDPISAEQNMGGPSS